MMNIMQTWHLRGAFTPPHCHIILHGDFQLREHYRPFTQFGLACSMQPLLIDVATDFEQEHNTQPPTEAERVEIDYLRVVLS
jgi:hypothetical protein